MEPINLPVRRVAELEAALTEAMERVADDVPLWIKLNKARAFVRAYLLDDAKITVEVA